MDTAVPATAVVGLGTIVVLGAALLAVIFGIVLAYHWYRFAADAAMATFALALYAVGAVIILALLVAALPGLLL